MAGKHFKYVPDWFVKEVKTWITLKWEWSIYFERYDGGWWPHREVFQTRWGARDFRRDLLGDKHRFIPAKEVRNVKMQRRLVQVNWIDYQDSYRHNAGRGR